MPKEQRPICNYEGSRYRIEFWEGQGREYEDRAERVALSRLLPPTGKRLIEVGAGYGRLADLYSGFEQIVLLDYARSQLQQARARLGHDERFAYVVADFYRLPFADNTFDTVVTVRVLHHAVDVPAVFAGIHRILAASGTYVLEAANKRNLKAILRYLFHRQSWSPFDLAPIEFVTLNFNFHPRWIAAQLQEQGFTIRRRLAVSYFRIPLLKRLLPAALLAMADRWLQPTGRFWALSPSVFWQAVAGSER